MAKTRIIGMIVGCELEADERNPEIGERKNVRVDLGGGIVARLPLDTPGIEKLGVGIEATLEMELDNTSLIPWHIPSDTEGMPGRSGYALKNVRLVSLKDGEDKIVDIKPIFVEKNWAEMTPTRTRSTFAPRTPRNAADGKAGGEQEQEETENLDTVE